MALICRRLAVLIDKRPILSKNFVRPNSNLNSSVKLSPYEITQILRKNEANLSHDLLPGCVQSIESNQLASNSPIEDRIRISSIRLPGSQQTTLILGVFDGHGGATTVDFISRRLFNYIALSLCPSPYDIKLSAGPSPIDLMTDLHSTPKLKLEKNLETVEFDALSRFQADLSKSPSNDRNIAENLKISFKRCDDDLSDEIQAVLLNDEINQRAIENSMLTQYFYAAISGCCALVMVIQEGIGYVASTGDCRAAMGICCQELESAKVAKLGEHTFRDVNESYSFRVTDLNEEHSCYNISEMRRLRNSHPISEQNTVVRENRLLGHLMPLRAFGDFAYKWPAEIIRASGLTQAFGPHVMPQYYNTPPYLIVEPDVKEFKIEDSSSTNDGKSKEKFIVIGTDGLWEIYENSREVMEALTDHTANASHFANFYDSNRATHLLRSTLHTIFKPRYSMDPEDSRRYYQAYMESMLTLPAGSSRNYRDDISILVVKLT